jgi:hypothetical protein
MQHKKPRLRRRRRPQIPKIATDRLLKACDQKQPATAVAELLREYAHRVFYEELRMRARILLHLRTRGAG